MSKFKSYDKKRDGKKKGMSGNAVENFMGGISYTINPLDTLKIISASSIFGEPSYYRGNHEKRSNLGHMMPCYAEPKETTTALFTKAIDQALDYDFEGTLRLAGELRSEYMMRLNPGVIITRASLHKDRADFNKNNPKLMYSIGKNIIRRPDDITNQLEYYLFLNGSKNNLPGIVKRIWASRLGEFDRYQISKYQSKGLRDLVRISHAHSPVIDELMKLQHGVLKLDENNSTWERLRSEGKSWKEIFSMIKIPHMALLRNLRGIFTEVRDGQLAEKILAYLQQGVPNGKQFPFRYYTALQFISESDANHKPQIIDALETCMDIAMENFPKLKGKTMCLSDNSGSAWGAFNSQYGKVTVADIGNLSSIMTAQNSDEGYVGVFGDTLKVSPVSKRNGVLGQHKDIGKTGKTVGGGTEHGIWIFFRNVIDQNEQYDNIFIYSDMQAGHGNLYGTNSVDKKDTHKKGGTYIDVLKMLQEYRSKVNPNVNLFSVQTAGYNNSVLPETLYRGAILAGWTGKEALYAKRIIDTWDGIEYGNRWPEGPGDR